MISTPKYTEEVRANTWGVLEGLVACEPSRLSVLCQTLCCSTKNWKSPLIFCISRPVTVTLYCSDTLCSALLAHIQCKTFSLETQTLLLSSPTGIVRTARDCRCTDEEVSAHERQCKQTEESWYEC